jgi:hypothetical protein
VFEGYPVAIVVASWYVLVGLAAAVVRPWSWYALLFSSLAFPAIWGGLHMVFFAYDWPTRIGVALVAVATSVFSFAYFYKRRAMFRARRRWRRLERWCPRLIGPQTPDTDKVPGFAGLSNPRRVFFTAILAALILLRQFDGVLKGIFGIVILLAVLLFVRRTQLGLADSMVRR